MSLAGNAEAARKHAAVRPNRLNPLPGGEPAKASIPRPIRLRYNTGSIGISKDLIAFAGSYGPVGFAAGSDRSVSRE